jgi:putative protease
MNQTASSLPQILAPAGNRASFLAALAAGADAVYCGLKLFSARMEAKNFTPNELAGLTDLAHSRGVQVYVTLNTLIKPDELIPAGKILDELNRHVHPDSLIIQDLAMIALARQTGFSGNIHLSTLANVSFGSALSLIRQIPGVDRVVLPRELSIDEIKAVASHCPEGLGLEFFIHGALCYGVSGRCYWSSFFGGKSGLRGRCVQPCRRLYTQDRTSKRFFSCQDLSLDILVKILRTVPEIKAWKIEGRKKSPHYVYYTVRAYQLLRDHGQDAHHRKEAISLLSHALGRTGTHYGFLSQRPRNPIQIDIQTGSGLCIGHVSGERSTPWVQPNQNLLPGDILRVGYEDEPWHVSLKISHPVPISDRFHPATRGKALPLKGTPVFLTDRREPELIENISQLESKIRIRDVAPPPSLFQLALPHQRLSKVKAVDQRVFRTTIESADNDSEIGIWLSRKVLSDILDNPDTPQRLRQPSIYQKFWWWLPPVLWPTEETDFKSLIDQLLQAGCRQFVLNAPWQIVFFKNPRQLTLWAGPFCNIGNPLAISQLHSFGFSGVIVSPELEKADYLQIPGRSPLPLGTVLSGSWPLCISRIVSDHLKYDTLFRSPKGEMAWVSLSDSNYWVYPNWKLDLTAFRKELEDVGYRRFIHLTEPIPPSIQIKDRPGTWNWKISLA